MNFKQLMERRYSARDFTSKEISDIDLNEIIEIAKFSPSWANSQPWNDILLVVTLYLKFAVNG